MENRFRSWLQPQCDHRLSDSVRDGGNSKNPCPTAMRFRYLNSPHRGRKIRPRGHPIPDLVQIVLQIGLELLDGLTIHPGSTLVPLDALIRLPHQLPSVSETVCPSDLTCPLVSSQTTTLVARVHKPQMSRSLRSTLITSASPLLRTGPPARAATVLNTSRFQPLSALPLAPDTTNPCQGQLPRPPSHVPYGSRRPDSRRLHAGHHLANKRAPARLIPGCLLYTSPSPRDG